MGMELTGNQSGTDSDADDAVECTDVGVGVDTVGVNFWVRLYSFRELPCFSC